MFAFVNTHTTIVTHKHLLVRLKTFIHDSSRMRDFAEIRWVQNDPAKLPTVCKIDRFTPKFITTLNSVPVPQYNIFTQFSTICN